MSNTSPPLPRKTPETFSGSAEVYPVPAATHEYLSEPGAERVPRSFPAPVRLEVVANDPRHSEAATTELGTAAVDHISAMGQGIQELRRVA